MLEVLVPFETPEEADSYFEDYKIHNNRAFKELINSPEVDIEALLGAQKYYFAVNLSADLENGKYLFKTTLFPFDTFGYGSAFDNFHTLAANINEIIDGLEYSVEPIFYTVNDHGKQNKECNDMLREWVDRASDDSDESECQDEPELVQMFLEIKEAHNLNERSLRDLEMQEFLDIYNQLSSKPSQD